MCSEEHTENEMWREMAALDQEESLFHVESMIKLTELGKIQWKLCWYDRPYLYVHYPDVEEKDADISHTILVETEYNGQEIQYELSESVLVPSGLCNIRIQEILPDDGYECYLSFAVEYEQLTTQKELLCAFGDHPLFLFAKTLMEALKTEPFDEHLRSPKSGFSSGSIPDEFLKLPIVQRSMELHRNVDAYAFHTLVLSNDLRDGLHVRD